MGILMLRSSQVETAGFLDHFDGSSLHPRWLALNRMSDQVNNEVCGMTDECVQVADSKLILLSKHEDITIGDTGEWATEPQLFPYKSGHVMQVSAPMLYGRFESRILACPAAGSWPLFWLLQHAWQASQPYTANVPGHAWPNQPWSEVDIMEFLNGSRTVNNCAAHVGTSNVDGYTLPFNSTSRFMKYALVWDVDLLRWEIDAEDGEGWRTMKEITGPTNVPTEPMYMVLSTAIGGAGGTPNPADYPAQSEYDYVSYEPA